MTIDVEENRVRSTVCLLRRLRAPGAGDEGISLLEVVIALVILAVVMTSAAGFFINGLRTTSGQSSRQAAISITNQQLEKVNALPSSSLLTGRYSAAVTRLLATDNGNVLTGQDDKSNSTSASYDYDPLATATSTPLIPTGVPVVAGNTADPNYNVKIEGKVSYQVRTFIDPCWLPTGTATSSNSTRNLACVPSSTPPSGAPGVTMAYRVTVATSWTGGPSTSCASGCSFNDSTLIDNHGDATFNSNISQPNLTGSTPASVGANSSLTLTLSGTGFVYGAAITITCDTCSATVGTVDQSTNTGTSIKVPVTFGSATGTATIRLTNPDGGTDTQTLTVGPAPAVTTYSPATVPALTSKVVTFTGTTLSATTVVTATGGTVGTVSYSAGKLTFPYTGDPAVKNPVFTLTNADGGTTTVSGITVTTSTPIITSASPLTAVHGATVTFTVTGTGFLTTTKPTIAFVYNGSYLFNGTATSVTATTATFSYTIPTTAGGSTYPVTVTLTNSDGGVSNTYGFNLKVT